MANNKDKYLKSLTAKDRGYSSHTYQLSARDYIPLIRHYNDKLHVDMRLNLENDVKNNQPLDNEKRLKEISDIAEEVKQTGRPVAYMLTYSATGDMKAHFETIIITPTHLIRPIPYPITSIRHALIDDSITEMTTKINLKIANAPGKLRESLFADPILLSPQASSEECGTLGVLYAKELLKNSASLLNDNSYIIDEGKDKPDTFIPAPDILRYSQSKKYINYIRSMVTENNDFKVELSSCENINERPCYQRLDDSSLEQFLQFRAKWVEGFEDALKKNEEMDKKGKTCGRTNFYLYKRALDMGKKITTWFKYSELQETKSPSGDPASNEKNRQNLK